MGEEAVKVTCVYCGVGGATTVDHIPPRCLFDRSPSTLIKVRRRTMSNFRMVLSFRHDVEHPDAEAGRQAAIRSLARAEASRLRAAFLQSAREVQLRTEAGLYLGRAGVYTVDTPRVDRVVRRNVTGLLYKEMGKPLPSGYAATTYLLEQIAELDSGVLVSVVARALEKPPQFIGQRTVAYRILHTTDDAAASACLVAFYERVTWLGITVAAKTP